MISMMPFDEGDFTTAIVPFMLGHPLTYGSIPCVDRLSPEFKSSGPLCHVRSSLRADPDRQMRLLGAKDPRLAELPGGLDVLLGERRGLR